MDFAFTEEQEAVRALAEQIFAGHASAARVKEVEAGVERFDRAFSDLCLPAGYVNDQRHARTNFIERIRLGPFSFFTEMVTMISPEDDNGFVAQV